MKARGESTIPGEEAFRLYDTYGFPLDLTMLMARERDLQVDEEDFRAHMLRRREQSRADSRFGRQADPAHWAKLLGGNISTAFVGYTEKETPAVLLAAEDGSIILDRTPFYAESGGQVADTGEIRGKDFTFRVKDVRKAGKLVVHEGEFTSGGTTGVKSDTVVTAVIDNPRRRSTARNHTATHLLHRVLRRHAGRGGGPGRLTGFSGLPAL